eukprot:14381405-Alexandrium_andersonii.AAC.1
MSSPAPCGTSRRSCPSSSSTSCPPSWSCRAAACQARRALCWRCPPCSLAVSALLSPARSRAPLT